MPGILIIFAHPRFQHARVNRTMLEAARTLDNVIIHDLYERYPDFHIDIHAEQDVLKHVSHVVLQFPLQWYSCPSLMKEWMDVVLQHGWAYGQDGDALRNKTLLCAVSVGGARQAYQADGLNRHPPEIYLKPFEQMAVICGMKYKEPFIFHTGRQMTDNQITLHADDYRQLLISLREGARG